MMIRHLLGYAATATVFGTTGWLMHAPDAARTPNVAAAAVTKGPGATPTQVDKRPLIAVASDGNVTLRVEQQPLEWVLDEIGRQSGWSDVRERARSRTTGMPDTVVATATPAVCAESPSTAPVQAEQLLQSIQRGSDTARFDGLLQARSEGVAVTDDTLRRLFETDASDSVRLLAFESFLDGRNGDPAALRGALEAALYVPNAAVQHEARQRLDELREVERVGATAVQRGPD